MSDERAARIAEFIQPLRVRPGHAVHLARDFDPRKRTGPVRKNKDGVELLRSGIALLAEYQVRLAGPGHNGHRDGKAKKHKAKRAAAHGAPA